MLAPGVTLQAVGQGLQWPLDTATTWRVLLSGSLLLAVAIMAALTDRTGEWRLQIRQRLLLGLPWGTLSVIGLLVVVYAVVQSGRTDWHSPVVLPFRAWSYHDPVAMALSGFAHSGPSHLTGNLLATAVYGTLAEYAWGHIPERRGEAAFGRPLANPVVRVLIFLMATLVVGLGLAVGSLGPTIGFSGVIFAYSGFALVRLPLVTVVGTVVAGTAGLVYRAALSPTARSAAESVVTTPWWAEIAIQGHALGLLVGLLVALTLDDGDGTLPGPGVLGGAVFLFATERGLWAVYGALGDGAYALYRAAGVGAVALIAAVVGAIGARGVVQLGERPVAPGRVARALLVMLVLVTAAVGVPYNLATVDDGPQLDRANAFEVDDYRLYYAENVTDQLVAAVDLPGVDTDVGTAGVIVTASDRQLWWTQITAAELAADGQQRIQLGGVGSRETVQVTRSGWAILGNGSVYSVSFAAGGSPSQTAFLSEPRRVEAVIDGRNLSVVPTREGFDIQVHRDGVLLDRGPVPTGNSTATIGGVRFRRSGSELVAERGRTRLLVASARGPR